MIKAASRIFAITDIQPAKFLTADAIMIGADHATEIARVVFPFLPVSVRGDHGSVFRDDGGFECRDAVLRLRIDQDARFRWL